jgi:hypothetical protein
MIFFLIALFSNTDFILLSIIYVFYKINITYITNNTYFYKFFNDLYDYTKKKKNPNFKSRVSLHYFVSSFPQALTTASLAVIEALSTIISILLVSSQAPNNLIGRDFLLIILFSSKISLFIVVIPFSAKIAKSDKFIILYSVLNCALENPFNLGILLNKGVCPHSNHDGVHPPALEF